MREKIKEAGVKLGDFKNLNMGYQRIKKYFLQKTA